MARTKDTHIAPADMPEILPAKATELMAAQDAALSSTEMDQIFASGMDIGRLEALAFITTVGESAALAVYENVKKSKAWLHLRDPNNSHGGNFESLDDFCRAKLGKSYNRLQTVAANRNLIGQDAFEQAERMGLRQVDYNAIKMLPAPDKELIRRAVEEEQSREQVLDLLQELAGRHAKVVETLTSDVNELRADMEANQKLLATKNAANDRLSLQLKKSLVAATDWPEAFKVLMDQTQFAYKNLKIQIDSLVAISEEALKPEAASEDEEASLTRAREALAEELLKVHRGCAQKLERVGMLFDKTLGSFASEGLYQ